MTKLLALDQSSRITGWAVFADGGLEAYGKFDAEAVGTDIGKRLKYIKTKVLVLIEKYQPTKVLIEDIQMQSTVGNNVVTFKTLAYVQAVLIEALTELSIPYELIHSSSWKSTLGIKGKARAEQKRNAQQWVVNTYSVKPTQDECDAICIGAHGCGKAPAAADNECAWA